jgi:hypothetical protein
MRRFVFIGSSLAIVTLVTVVLMCRVRQTGLGEIKRVRMTEPHAPTRFETVVSKARDALHLAAMDTRKGNYLTIGSAQMEWSLMSTREKTGWLYFAKPLSNDPLWEFAPCSRSNLRDLTPGDLNAQFVHLGDTNMIRTAFDGALWEKISGQTLDGRAITVKEGQVILARLIDSPRTIYAMMLIDQRGTDRWGSIDVEYVSIDLTKTEPGDAASRSQPVRAETKRDYSNPMGTIVGYWQWEGNQSFWEFRRDGTCQTHGDVASRVAGRYSLSGGGKLTIQITGAAQPKELLVSISGNQMTITENRGTVKLHRVDPSAIHSSESEK